MNFNQYTKPFIRKMHLKISSTKLRSSCPGGRCVNIMRLKIWVNWSPFLSKGRIWRYLFSMEIAAGEVMEMYVSHAI